MNTEQQHYESFPLMIVILRNLLELILLSIGAYFLLPFGWQVVIIYLVFSMAMLLWLMRFSCRYCYYYGNVCPNGYGKIVPLFFKKGDEQRFTEYTNYIAPVFLIWVVPLLIGIYRLIKNSSLLLLLMLVLFVVLRVTISEIIHDCDHCRQKKNCPSYHFKCAREKKGSSITVA